MASIVRTCDVVARWGGERIRRCSALYVVGRRDVGRRAHPCRARTTADLADPGGPDPVRHCQLWRRAASSPEKPSIWSSIELIARCTLTKSAGRKAVVLSTVQLVTALHSLTPQSIPQEAHRTARRAHCSRCCRKKSREPEFAGRSIDAVTFCSGPEAALTVAARTGH